MRRALSSEAFLVPLGIALMLAAGVLVFGAIIATGHRQWGHAAALCGWSGFCSCLAWRLWEVLTARLDRERSNSHE